MPDPLMPEAVLAASGDAARDPSDKLQTVIASLDEGLLVLDEDLLVESINAQGEAILEVAADAVLGRSIDELAQGWNLRDRGPFAVSKMRHHLIRGLPYRNDDAFVVAADGHIHHVSLVMTPIGPADRRTGAVICLRDITELKLAEARLRHSEQRFRRIFESAPTGMLRVSATGEVDESNGTVQEILGHEAVTLDGRSLRSLWHPEDAADNEVVFRNLFADADPGLWQGELRFQHADGTTIWTNTSLARVGSADEEAGFAIAVVEDITQRKRLEIELRHAQKLESIGRLSAGIAHELNSPVQFIGDNLHFLESAFGQLSRLAHEPGVRADDLDDLQFLLEEVPDAIHQTLDGIGRISGIVRAMQGFGGPSGGLDDVDVNEAVRTTVMVAAGGIGRVAEVETVYGEVPAIPCTAIDLNQVLLNLLVNAADAISDVVGGTGERGRIRVATRAHRDGAEITVTDTGTGIAPEHRARVFDPFFTTKDVGRGTGQGLSVAHAVIVERHGGELGFDSEVGRGTTFRIWLPATPSKGAGAGSHEWGDGAATRDSA